MQRVRLFFVVAAFLIFGILSFQTQCNAKSLNPVARKGKLFVDTEPADASVRFTRGKKVYKPGGLLVAGKYIVEVSKPGFETTLKEVLVKGGKETRVRVVLQQNGQAQQSESATEEPNNRLKSHIFGKLALLTTPENAVVKFLNADFTYHPDMTLEQGRYSVEISANGYATHVTEVEVQAGMQTKLTVRLKKEKNSKLGTSTAEQKQAREKQTSASGPSGKLYVETDPSDARITFANSGRSYQPGMELAPGSYQLEVRKSGYQTRVKSIEINPGRDSWILVSLNKGEGIQLPDSSNKEPAQTTNKTTQPDTSKSDAYSLNMKNDLGKANKDADAQKQGISPEEQAAADYTVQGNQYVADGDAAQAMESYNQALRQVPNYKGALRGRAFLHYSQGNNKQALKDYDRAISEDPHDAVAYFERGNVYLNLRKYKLALKNYNKAIELDPNYADFHNARGSARYAAKDYLNALQDYSRAISLDKKYDDAYYNRGAAHYKLGMYELAIKDLDKALELDPSDRDAHNMRAQSYKALGK